MSEEMENRAQENGQITYANEVISTIVTVATLEVEGISGITGGGAISGIITRGRTPRGVKVDVKGDKVNVDISVSVDYGIPIQKVGRNCQENVRKSIETMTGLKVERVDLHVVSVSFEKENQELDKGQRLALTLDGETTEEKAAELVEEPVDEVTLESGENAKKIEEETEIVEEIEETAETEEDEEDIEGNKEEKDSDKELERAESYTFEFEAEPEDEMTEDHTEDNGEEDEEDEKVRDFDEED